MLNKKLKTCALLFATLAGTIGLSGCSTEKKPGVDTDTTITTKTGTVIILASENGVVTASKDSGNVNDIITLTVKPNEGYALVSLKLGNSDLEVKDGKASFKLTAGQNIITSVFAKVKTGSVIILDSEHGKVEANKTTGDAGQTVNLTITPEENYNIISLKRGNEDIIVKNNKATFTIKEGDNVIVAKFGYKQGSVAFDNITNGKIEADKTTANIGETVTLTITPNTNYALEWIKLGDQALEVKEGKATFVLTEGQNVITAKFSAIKGNIVFNQHDFGSATSNKTEGNIGEEVVITVTPNVGFEIHKLYVVCSDYDWEDENRQREFVVTDNKVTITLLKGENSIILVKTELPCVKFMVEDENGSWQLHSRKLISNGKIEGLPAEPTKKYYDFAGWSMSSEKDEPFVNENLEKVNTVYARFRTILVDVTFGSETSVPKNLIDMVKEYENEKLSGTEIKWFTDSGKTNEWYGNTIVDKLYVEEIATITYNNGYEDVYSTYVKKNGILKDPRTTMINDGETKVSLEKYEIVEDYMDEKDINYVTETGEEFVFGKQVTKNTEITVNWNTKDISSYLTEDKASNSWFIKSTNFGAWKSAPAYSIQGKVTDDKGKTVAIKGVFADTLDIIDATAEKVIFGEGIEFITGVNSESGNAVKEIVFPKSLKIIDNSFSNFNSLTGVTLNEGLEVLIGSFFKDVSAPDYYTVSYGKNYDFDIAVPNTVKNIAMVPTNLTFEKTEENAAKGDFYKGNDGRIYLNEERGKVLISDNDNVGHSTIYVPEGVNGIQVGTYNSYYDYLYLPKTFEFVNYNASIKNYPYFQFSEASSYTAPSLRLFDEEHIRAPQKFMNSQGYSISNTTGGFFMIHPLSQDIHFRMGGGEIIVARTSFPKTLNQYAFVGDPVGGYASRNGGYIGLFNSAISEHVHFKGSALDDLQSLFIVFNLPDDSSPSYPVYTLRGIVSNDELAKEFTLNDLVEIVKIQNPSKVEKIDKKLKYDDADKPAAKAETKPAAPKEPINLILVVNNKTVEIDKEGKWRQTLLVAKYITINFKPEAKPQA